MTGAKKFDWELARSGDGAAVTGQIHLPPDETRDLPVVIFGPDLLHPLSWGFYPFLAAQVGKVHPFIIYNASHSGFEAERGIVGRASLVEEYTVSSELGDIANILAALRDGGIPGSDRIDMEKVVLGGHAKGAALALLAAGQHLEVKALALMSALSTLFRFPPEVRQEISRTGFLEVDGPVCGTRVKLGRKMVDELEGDPGRFSLETAIREFSHPAVIMHGEEDREVAVKESESLYHWCRKDQTRLVLMEKVGHNFGADHPFVKSNKDLDRVVEIFTNFINQTFEK